MREKNPIGGGCPAKAATTNECEGPGPTSYLRTFCIIMAVYERTSGATHSFHPKSTFTGVVGIEHLEFVPTERPWLTQLHTFKPISDQSYVPMKQSSTIGLQQCYDIRELIEFVRAL